MNDSQKIADFLSEGPWAVVGASRNRAKFGNKVLRSYLEAGKRPVWPVNPGETEIEGERSYPDLASLPEVPRVVSIITPPDVTESIVEEAVELGIQRLWLQPGAENERVLVFCEHLELEVLSGGPCVLVELGFRG